MSNMISQFDWYISPEEYLAAERVSETRHEYLAGVVYAMSGGSRAHAYVSRNILSHLTRQLQAKQCQPAGPDLRVRIRRLDATFYYYPDVVVDCSSSTEDFVDEPTVIFEVLSPSTDRADRGEKMYNYRLLPSLQAYLLVDQFQKAVLVHRRKGDAWQQEQYTDEKATIEHPEIGCSLPLAEIYLGVL